MRLCKKNFYIKANTFYSRNSAGLASVFGEGVLGSGCLVCLACLLVCSVLRLRIVSLTDFCWWWWWVLKAIGTFEYIWLKGTLPPKIISNTARHTPISWILLILIPHVFHVHVKNSFQMGSTNGIGLQVHATLSAELLPPARPDTSGMVWILYTLVHKYSYIYIYTLIYKFEGYTHIDRGPIAGGLSKHPCILYIMCLKSHGHVFEAWESFIFFLCHGCQILACRVWGSPQWRTCTRYCTIDNAHARNSRWWTYWEDTSKDCPSKACSQHVLNVAFLMRFGQCAKVLAAAMQASPSNRVWMPNSVKHSGCASLDPVSRTSWVQCLQPSTMLPCLRFDAQFWTPSICEVTQNWSII